MEAEARLLGGDLGDLAGHEGGIAHREDAAVRGGDLGGGEPGVGLYPGALEDVDSAVGSVPFPREEDLLEEGTGPRYEGPADEGVVADRHAEEDAGEAEKERDADGREEAPVRAPLLGLLLDICFVHSFSSIHHLTMRGHSYYVNAVHK
jgi:hypothetical protein